MIIDEEKKELPEIVETYTDTWGKMVKVAILKEYVTPTTNGGSILTLSLDFANIENIDIITKTEGKPEGPYTEQFHLDGVTEEIYQLYNKLKQQLLSLIPSINFNPQRYYISLRKKRNFAFIKIRRKKISIIAMLEEEKIREKIKHYEITSLTDSVQKFYNGPCARIEITNDKYLKEVLDLLVEIQK